MPAALILLDIQNDYLPGGRHPVPDGDAILPAVHSLLARGLLTVATQDWHPAGHQAFADPHARPGPGARPPPHCIQGTHGAALTAELDTARIAHRVRKGMDPNVDAYSGFFDQDRRIATGLAGLLRRDDASRLYLCGLALDDTVLHTALDAVSLGFETWVVEDACRSREPLQTEAIRARLRHARVGLCLASAVQTVPD